MHNIDTFTKKFKKQGNFFSILAKKHNNKANAYKNPQQAAQGMSATIQQKAEDYFHTLNEPSQQSTAHKKQCNQNDNANNRQYSHLYFSISLLSDVATILPHVDIAVCIYLNVFPVGRQ